MTGPRQSGGLAAVFTAGGVVFFGDDDGQVVAVDAVSGRHPRDHYSWRYADRFADHVDGGRQTST